MSRDAVITSRTMTHGAAASSVVVLLAVAALAADAPPRYAVPEQTGEVENELVMESSGLAVSRRDPNLLWTHNDSGDGPVLYLMDTKGKALGAVMIAGVWARDWEDLTSVVLDDKPMLVVGDVGDNAKVRRRLTVYLVEEPQADDARPSEVNGREIYPKVEATAVHVAFPDGAHDCEALAVDSATRRLFLITKVWRGDGATAVYRAKLPVKPTDQTQTLEKVTELAVRPVTAMDMSPDGWQAAVLTPEAAYLFDRGEGEDWAAAFARTPEAVSIPDLRQGEAIAFGPDGRTLYLTSEQRPTPIWRIAPADEPEAAPNP